MAEAGNASRVRSALERLSPFPNHGRSPRRYRLIRRNMILLMVVVTVVPLLLMAVINYHQYQRALMGEIVNPMRVLANKTGHSFELYLTERISAVSFIASAYTREELADRKTLRRIFSVMQHEFGGFIDLGLIDESGVQVSYAGPYDLEGKNYSEQSWFHEAMVRGSYISDVFMGYRRIPHFAIAVKHTEPSGESWIIRATIDSTKYDNLIASMGLEPSSDAFLLNRSGVLQTTSKHFGRVLDNCPLSLPSVSHEASVFETVDKRGRDVFVAYTYFSFSNLLLMIVKPRGDIFKSWYTLKSEIFLLFLVSVAVIFLVVFTLTNRLVRRIEESDQKRKQAYHQMEYTNKLASIGRLAAGVAHEINNPMAIINEKAGLMKDLTEGGGGVDDKEKFLELTNSILRSVDRCRSVTHRLLGFARHMDVQEESLDMGNVITEVVGFIEKEAFHRNITIDLDIPEEIPRIVSDQGQLQQVFLNILNNAFEAVEDGGHVKVTCFVHEKAMVGVSIEDDGSGMSEETRKHIFEPFFTTKKGYGTGLGLSITYGIIKKLGGEIEVESREGEGTRFTVLLPTNKKDGA